MGAITNWHRSQRHATAHCVAGSASAGVWWTTHASLVLPITCLCWKSQTWRCLEPLRLFNCSSTTPKNAPLIYTNTVLYRFYGPGSSVGIATELRAGRSGIESWWGRDFPPVQTGPGAQPAGTGSFPRVKCGRGVLLNTHPLLVPRSGNSWAIPLPTLWATPGL